MSIFSKYRPYYVEPQRLATDQASRLQRKVESELKRNLELQERWGRLSADSLIANSKHIDNLRAANERLRRVLDAPDYVVNKTRVLKTELYSSRALRGLSLPTLAGLLQREKLNKAKAQPIAPRVRSQANAGAAASRNFSFGPQDYRNPRTVFGTEAFHREFTLGRRKFLAGAITIPCVQRGVRREVMFAKGYAPGGHRGRHRRTPYSSIWC